MANFCASDVRVNFIVHAISEQEARSKLDASLGPLINVSIIPSQAGKIGRRMIIKEVKPSGEMRAYQIKALIVFDDDDPRNEAPPQWLFEIITSHFDPSVQFVDLSEKSVVFGN